MESAPHQSYRRSLNALMNEAGRHSVPTAAEEKKLVAAAKRGDKRATHSLVLGHLRLVLKMAHGLSRNADLFEDLAAAGIAGMIEAIGDYKASSNKGGRFMHYAVYHIRRQMRRALNDFRTPVTANPNNYDLARKIFDFEEKVLREEGRRVSHAETGKKFGLTPNRVERAKKLMEKPMYLDHAIGGEDERAGHDVCADKNAGSPALLTELNMESELLQEMMNAHLSERELTVLKRRFGFGGGHEEDLQAIGSDFDLSRERVRQIEVQALKKLRFHLSQRCQTYRSRAGQHPALVPSSVKVEVPARQEQVMVLRADKKTAKLRLVPASQEAVLVA